jgi:Bacterial HORMA domain family 1
MAYTNTMTASVSASVTATEARVRSVLRQVRVDLLGAACRGFIASQRVEDLLDDLAYMLQKNALSYFEIRVSFGETTHRAWRYVVSDDGRLAGVGQNGGGIDFYEIQAGANVSLVISRRQGLPRTVTDEIDRRGWTHPVASLQGEGVRERAYEKDGYGLIRHRFDLT